MKPSFWKKLFFVFLGTFIFGCAQTVRQDELVLGRPASTNDKCITFDSSTASAGAETQWCGDDTTNELYMELNNVEKFRIKTDSTQVKDSSSGEVGLEVIQGGAGDAFVDLIVNNDTTPNTWRLFVDNDATDTLEISYDAADVMRLNSGGDVEIRSEESTAEFIVTNFGTTSEDSAIKLRVNDSASNEWAIFLDNDASDNLIFSYAGTEVFQMTTGGAADLDGALSAGNQGSSHRAFWKVYTGTISCGVNGGCNEIIDASTPGSGAPLTFSCGLDGIGTDDIFFPDLLSTGATLSFADCSFIPWYDSSEDDLVIRIPFDDSCNNVAFKCIAFFEE